MRYIMRTCAGREHYAEKLIAQLPEVEVCFDDIGGAMQCFIKSLEMAGNDAVVNMEDDIILTNGFKGKIESTIAKRRDSVIQFFSMRKADLTIGSRWDAGRNYLMAQCTYFPAKISSGILSFSQKYDNIGHKSHPLDSMVADYLVSTKQKYWIHCPSLVDHIVGKSMIDLKRASTNRQSFTFEAEGQ